MPCLQICTVRWCSHALKNTASSSEKIRQSWPQGNLSITCLQMASGNILAELSSQQYPDFCFALRANDLLYCSASTFSINTLFGISFFTSSTIIANGALKNSLLLLIKFILCCSRLECNFFSRAGASSHAIIAWTSNSNGTLASPSSRTRSYGSSLRVIPILKTFSPNDPIFEITYT